MDSSTINDRLTTMPDIIQTQGSNQLEKSRNWKHFGKKPKNKEPD